MLIKEEQPQKNLSLNLLQPHGKYHTLKVLAPEKCIFANFPDPLRNHHALEFLAILERLAKQLGLSAMDFAELIKGRGLNFTGRLFSSEHNRWFATEIPLYRFLRDNDRRLTLTANRIPISQWFSEQYDKLRQSFRQPIQPKKSRGMKL